MPLYQPLFISVFGKISPQENFAPLSIYKTLQTNLQEVHFLGTELAENLAPETF